MDDSPCVDCRHSSRCQLEKLGCEALLLHMRGASADRIKFAPRQPNQEALARALAGIQVKAAKRPRVLKRYLVFEE